MIFENGNPKTVLTEAGFVSLNDNKYHYYLQDHQGNNRVVTDQNGNVEEVNHYYPFGGVFASSGNIQPYKYNGKELDTANGMNWYDYGARHYDAALGRFMKADRYSEKYVSISPYQYAANNPVNIIDINGDSLSISKNNAESAIRAIYNGLQSGSNITMKWNNRVLDPSSIEEQAKSTSDFFLKDLYEIASNEKMVELSVSDKNTYMMNGKIIEENFISPYDYNTNQDLTSEEILKSIGQPTGSSIQGNLGQTLVPDRNLQSGKKSVGKNIEVIINAMGNQNHRTVGIAHEFGHVILYLRNKPFSHRQEGVDDFVYNKSTIMSKRLGYDF